MRFIVSLLFWGTLVGSAVPEVTAQTPTPDATPITIELGQRLTLSSDILGEDRQVFVRLPEGYSEEGNTSRYPVIYVLDGERHFNHASIGADILEENERMPESIIIALPNNRGTRRRDLAGSPDNFRRFIGEELFSYVDANYRTSGNKTLFGHSLAGKFTLSILAGHSDMFDNYIAASPAINTEDVANLDKFLSGTPALSKSVFFTQTSAAEERQSRWDAVEKVAAIFKEKAPATLKWRYDYIGDQVHMTTPMLTVYPGLSFVFSDYQVPNYLSTKAFDDAGGMSALTNFFTKRAAKYGTEDGLSQASLRMVASLYSREGMHDRAIELYQANVTKHPSRHRVYNSLGSGYYAAGQYGKAQEAYETAIKLTKEQNAPAWATNWYQRNLERLKEKMAE